MIKIPLGQVLTQEQIVDYWKTQLTEQERIDILDEYRYSEVEFSDWCDYVEEDIATAGALLGFAIETHRKQGFSRSYEIEYDVHAGDFAFDSDYRLEPDAVDKIRSAYPSEEALASAAKKLTTLQVTAFLETGSYLGATTSRRAYTCTPGINAALHFTSGDEFYREGDEELLCSYEAEFEAILELFTDWVIAQLRDAYEWSTSDEATFNRIEANDQLRDEIEQHIKENQDA